MTPEITAAIEEFRLHFPGHPVEVVPEPQGGAYVTVANLDIGRGFRPTMSWCGFLMTFQYPRADVYPHFMDPAVVRADGSSLPSGLGGPVDWQGQKAVQISRRSNRWDPTCDTA